MTVTIAWAKRILSLVFSALIRGYQIVLSPLFYLLFPSWGCRFFPSCSEYALECMALHGPLKGSYLSLKRIGRCHPFHPGGADSPPTLR